MMAALHASPSRLYSFVSFSTFIIYFLLTPARTRRGRVNDAVSGKENDLRDIELVSRNVGHARRKCFGNA